MLEKRSVSLSGHRTSIALEPEFWASLREIAQREHLSLAGLIGRVDTARTPDQRLASALRVYVLKTLRPSIG